MQMTRAYFLKATMNGFGAVALAASFVVGGLPGGAYAQEPSPPLTPDVKPIEGRQNTHVPSPRDVVADFHLESTVLGFDQGVGPAVGRELSYNGKQYTVADVYTVDGQPCFSGGSHFTIAPAGGRLVIGLKANGADSITVASLK
jgi:hypothetical protein